MRGVETENVFSVSFFIALRFVQISFHFDFEYIEATEWAMMMKKKKKRKKKCILKTESNNK